ncbi:hypothetical protein PGTUg99_033438 [Puccinia graminis f. sp. tritici]|uniref:Uncharacterized protein n=1 Tax=Puccinia graminis f. sp. tritici TaxID=56615 RepID=A0A5B0Q990_PUCGR|nr:hypothetical protein PGTUg99_033438 [Puccinia graminis f. sp. tritici]
MHEKRVNFGSETHHHDNYPSSLTPLTSQPVYPSSIAHLTDQPTAYPQPSTPGDLALYPSITRSINCSTLWAFFACSLNHSTRLW